MSTTGKLVFTTPNFKTKAIQPLFSVHGYFYWLHQRLPSHLSSRCLQGPRPNLLLRLSSSKPLHLASLLSVTIAYSRDELHDVPPGYCFEISRDLSSTILRTPFRRPATTTSTMPPTGPRAGASTTTRQTRSSTGASRPSARGGIAKRGRGPAPRVDRDGDLVMDAAAGGNKSGAGINKNNSSTRRGTTRPSAPKANTRLQQNLARQLGGDTSQVPNAPSAARLAANNTTLKILGMKSSKAATNPDKGEKRLLEFLERKASTLKGPSRRHVTIKKVCQGIR